MTLRSQGVCTGSGTTDDPYVISGYEITGTNSSTCITVLNITKHLVVTNCYLHGDFYGIMVRGSSNVTVTNSNCSGNYYFGVFLYYTANDTVTNNVCIDAGHGIELLGLERQRYNEQQMLGEQSMRHTADQFLLEKCPIG